MNNPGTKEAKDAGCTCPVLDNHYGLGYMGNKNMFCYKEGCPVHYPMDISRPYLDEQAKIRTGTGTPSGALDGLPMFGGEDE